MKTSPGTNSFGRWIIVLVIFLSVTLRAETEVLRVSGRVSVSKDKGTTWAALKGKVRYEGGVVFKTETNAFVDVRFDGGSLMRVTEGSRVGVDRTLKLGSDVDILIDLKSGRMCAISTNLSTASTFQVKTPVGVCGVRIDKTSFDATSRGDFRCADGQLTVVYVIGPFPAITLEPGEGIRPPPTGVAPLQVSKLGPTELAQVCNDLDDLRRTVTK